MNLPIPQDLIELIERPLHHDAFAELVQDRASELITHFDNRERVSEIAKELYEVATAMVKR